MGTPPSHQFLLSVNYVTGTNISEEETKNNVYPVLHGLSVKIFESTLRHNVWGNEDLESTLRVSSVSPGPFTLPPPASFSVVEVLPITNQCEFFQSLMISFIWLSPALYCWFWLQFSHVSSWFPSSEIIIVNGMHIFILNTHTHGMHTKKKWQQTC